MSYNRFWQHIGLWKFEPHPCVARERLDYRVTSMIHVSSDVFILFKCIGSIIDTIFNTFECFENLRAISRLCLHACACVLLVEKHVALNYYNFSYLYLYFAPLSIRQNHYHRFWWSMIMLSEKHALMHFSQPKFKKYKLWIALNPMESVRWQVFYVQE